MEDLKKVVLAIGGEANVVKKLGEGGQGIVYVVQYEGRNYALKWYKPGVIKKPDVFYANIEKNIKRGTPSKAFLWPRFLTVRHGDQFGYLMDLRPPEFKDFSKFLLAKERFGSAAAVIRAALDMVDGFMKLHAQGLSYQDLNDGNFFINPQTGKVLICDNDNVAPDKTNLGIGGKSRYMAPEVVLGLSLPDKTTDRFSLAVTLFMLMFFNHPLEGAYVLAHPAMNEEIERKLYAEQYTFIFDPVKTTNRPVRGVHDNAIKLWPKFPKFVQEAFVKSFDMATVPAQRLRETEWLKIFLRLRDSTIKCAKCGKETFVNPDQPSYTCVQCGQTSPRPIVLKAAGRYSLVLGADTKLWENHLRVSTSDDDSLYRNEVGEVIQNKLNPSLWGVRNNSTRTWICTKPNGEDMNVAPGGVVPIFKDMKINFGSGLTAIME
jgi:DNA-binding helix-hairpin-helix protein with protein kinase domain